MNLNMFAQNPSQLYVLSPAFVMDNMRFMAYEDLYIELPLYSDSRTLMLPEPAASTQCSVSETCCSKSEGFVQGYYRTPCDEKTSPAEKVTLPSQISAHYEQQFHWASMQKESINKVAMMYQEISPKDTHFESNESQPEELDQKDYWKVEYRMNSVTRRQNTVYVCKFPGCDREFKKKWNYTEHFKAHSHAKPFECPECGKLFSQKGSLLKHIKSKSEGSKYHGYDKFLAVYQKKKC